MAIISKQVLSVENLLSEKLVIPTYQRPYKWRIKHVNQLLDDIVNHKAKSCYRLGTVVLYQDETKKTESAIVDGQQRLLTLTLLCSVLSSTLTDNKKIENKNEFKSALLTHHFESRISINNLQHNAKVLENRIKQLTEHEQRTLLEFVFNQCELIVVTLDNLSEAFQFFDSQNARGKALAPYDLLKAYHLREMMQNSNEKERLTYVEAWEQGVNPDNKMLSLHTIMGDFLFRMRRWIDGDNGVQFSRHNIEVFKGVNLDTSTYNYVESMLALDYAVNNYNADPVREWDKQRRHYPFQVNQIMINGKHFFGYIQHYIALYEQLFNAANAPLSALLKDYTQYDGSHRKGDRYVKNLFICVVMYYYDKFGNIELTKAVELCFLWSYQLRLSLQKIGFESVDNHARLSNGLFKAINKAVHPQQVLSYHIPAMNSARFKNAESVKDKFTTLGYLHE